MEFTQVIKCPKCSEVQEATVEYSFPWNVYIHECKKCKYLIMESEWDEIKEQSK